MLLILSSWCYVFITLVNFGFVAISITKFRTQNKFLHLVLGLIFILIISHVWAFFDGFGILFHSLLLLSNIIIAFAFRKKSFSFLKDIQEIFFNFSRAYQLLITVILILILAKSASQGSFIDNENYYIQTIKWLNEYGFVQGLANFNLLLAQSSGWHVLQSVFSFHFLNVELNDLGGFLLLLMNIYVLKLAHDNVKSFSIFVWMPLLNWFLLELCVVPSPDFGIIFFGVSMCFVFLKSFKNLTKQGVQLLLLLFLSAMLIKITVVGLVVFPLVLLYKLKTNSLQFHLVNLVFVILFVSLLVGKNVVISAYPFYPSDVFSEFFSFQHQIPEALYEFSLRKEKLFEFFASTEEEAKLSNFQLFWKWLTYSKISIFFNILTLICIIGMPFLISRFKSKSALWWVYFSFVVQLVFLAFTSPQYRFVLHYLILFFVMLLNYSTIASKFRILLVSCSQILVLVFILFPIPYGQFSSKDYNLKSQSFQLKTFSFQLPILLLFQLMKQNNWVI